jgi:hypothetical protein
MARISRRSALGSVAASALVGLGSQVKAETPQAQPSPEKSKRPVKPMTLDEFKRMNTPIAVEDLFRHGEGHTFMMCHKDMREKHGIWIPELVPIFEKMDAMRAASNS